MVEHNGNEDEVNWNSEYFFLIIKEERKKERNNKKKNTTRIKWAYFFFNGEWSEKKATKIGFSDIYCELVCAFISTREAIEQKSSASLNLVTRDKPESKSDRRKKCERTHTEIYTQ